MILVVALRYAGFFKGPGILPVEGDGGVMMDTCRIDSNCLMTCRARRKKRLRATRSSLIELFSSGVNPRAEALNGSAHSAMRYSGEGDNRIF